LKALEVENARLKRAVASSLQHDTTAQYAGLSATCTGNTGGNRGNTQSTKS